MSNKWMRPHLVPLRSPQPAGGGSPAPASATFVTTANECASLPNSRRLAVSGDLTLTDNGPCSTIVVGHVASTAVVTSANEVTIDFGTSPVWSKAFTIVDAGISATSKIIAVHSANVTDDPGEELDPLTFRAKPAAGSMTLYANAHYGPVVSTHKVAYLVAT